MKANQNERPASEQFKSSLESQQGTQSNKQLSGYPGREEREMAEEELDIRDAKYFEQTVGMLDREGRLNRGAGKRKNKYSLNFSITK